MKFVDDDDDDDKMMFADDDFVDTSGDVKTVADYYADVATDE